MYIMQYICIHENAHMHTVELRYSVLGGSVKLSTQYLRYVIYPTPSNTVVHHTGIYIAVRNTRVPCGSNEVLVYSYILMRL